MRKMFTSIGGFFVRHRIGLTITAVLLVVSMVLSWFAFPKVLVIAATKMTGAPVETSQGMVDGDFPSTTKLLDKNGDVFAELYTQRRTPVESDQISHKVKDAVVDIEDRRFYDHGGIDYKGTLRSLIKNITGGDVEQGASTLDQQYIKNYTWLVEASGDEEQAAAISQNYGRKVREMALSKELEKKLSKDEILTHYLNLVSYGNGAYGIEEAAHTYFGVSAADLDLPQSAMLAGIVQSPYALDPYTNPDGMTERRNLVLDAMKSAGDITDEEYARAESAPLGILDSPAAHPTGCSAAGDAAYFCDYVRTWLEQRGVGGLEQAGYTIRTSLDPAVQDNTTRALKEQSPDSATSGVAEVMNVIEPGTDSRRVLAMGSSQDYGLDEGQTVQPLPFSSLGHGAGSIFKIFTATAAMNKGMGYNTVLDTPATYAASGMGTSDRPDCPADKYCVSNSGNYPAKMSLQDALAQSPNTPFVQLTESVGLNSAVDMAVKLGLRSYAQPGSWTEGVSVADQVKNNTMGSFVLGPTSVNAVELANVGATLASEGMWCSPTPVDEITDDEGKSVDFGGTQCDQAVDAGVADAMTVALSQDAVKGTAAAATQQYGWSTPISAKTGTTEDNMSAAFLGFNHGFASAVYAFNSGDTPMGLCTAPLRQCESGDLFGGSEPARTFFSAMSPMATALNHSTDPLTASPEYAKGTAVTELQSLIGQQQYQAISQMEQWGYPEPTITKVHKDGKSAGTVVGISGGAPLRGARMTLQIAE